MQGFICAKGHSWSILLVLWCRVVELSRVIRNIAQSWLTQANGGHPLFSAWVFAFWNTACRTWWRQLMTRRKRRGSRSYCLICLFSIVFILCSNVFLYVIRILSWCHPKCAFSMFPGFMSCGTSKDSGFLRMTLQSLQGNVAVLVNVVFFLRLRGMQHLQRLQVPALRVAGMVLEVRMKH